MIEKELERKKAFDKVYGRKLIQKSVGKAWFLQGAIQRILFLYREMKATDFDPSG